MDIAFTFMSKNTPTSHVVIKDSEVIDVQIFNQEPGIAVILAKPPIDFRYINGIVSMRCFERCNANAELFLHAMGLKEYDPWEIVKITHGFMWEDFVWMKFDGEDLRWEDINHGRN